MIDFLAKNDIIDDVFERYKATYALVRDTDDYVPDAAVDRFLLYVEKDMSKAFKLVDKEYKRELRMQKKDRKRSLRARKKALRAKRKRRKDE